MRYTHTSSVLNPRRILLLALLVIPVLGLRVNAQDADPRQILEESQEAISGLEGFVAKVTLSGDGSAMIVDTLPSMNARINFGTHPEYGKVIHMLGQLRPTKTAAPDSFDIAYTADKYIWTDHTKSTVNIYPPSVSVRQRPKVFSYVLFSGLVNDEPFTSELATAESVDLEADQSIGGVACKVINITRSKNRQGSSGSSHSNERWFIGAEDKLPRRVEHITDAGMIKATLIMEMTDLVVGPQAEGDLTVYAPESFRVVDTTKKRAPAATENRTRPVVDTTPQPAQPVVPKDPPAPNYAFTDINNTSISRATQAGRMTVLYFFGSWSIPSRETTPMINELTKEFSDQAQQEGGVEIDTFAIALRESDPSSLKDQQSRSPIAPSLTINPDSSLSTMFKVRVYPTIIVIDRDGRIVFNEHLSKDRDATALIKGAKAAITKSLR